MANRILVATRKGLFLLDRNGASGKEVWNISKLAFLGSTVTMAYSDPRDLSLYTALNLGRFASKLHHSRPPTSEIDGEWLRGNDFLGNGE